MKGKKEEMSGCNIAYFLIFLAFYGTFMMFLYGMAKAYYPEPIEIIAGSGFYMDVSIGVIFFGTGLFALLVALLGFSYYMSVAK